ncbi:MAG: magnesium transporter, partial [Clostridiales bacterium]|nr:magnesium transporter [Clostridiales bacterium]
ERKYKELRELLSDMEPVDIAALTSELPRDIIPLTFRLLPKELAADAFVEMDTDLQETLIQAFSDLELKEVLQQLFLDDTVDIIEEMPANVVKRILKNSDPSVRQDINEVLHYPKDSAGSVMTNEYVDLRLKMTVEDAFKRIKRVAIDRETIYTCYVTDQDRMLLGLVTAKTLMLSEPDDIIEDIMETNVISSLTTDDKEDCADKISKYDLLAIPIVDTENRLVGIVTFDDAIDVIKEATEDDFAKMAAVTPSENKYFRTSVLTHTKNRVIWLLVLMLSGILTGAIIAKFEDAIAAIPALVSFIPMLMDTSGNSGTQASTMVIRGMAMDEIHLRDFLRVWFKEIRIALLGGVILAAVNTARILIQYQASQESIYFAITTSITLLCVICIAKSFGVILPMLAKKLHLDPAVAASPVLTTICDICTVTIYFALITFFFKLA